MHTLTVHICMCAAVLCPVLWIRILAGRFKRLTILYHYLIPLNVKRLFMGPVGTTSCHQSII